MAKDNKTANKNSPADKAESVTAGEWRSSEKRVRRNFPGPRDAQALLRVATERALP